MHCMLLCVLEAADGGLCLLEAPEVMCYLLLYMLRTVERDFEISIARSFYSPSAYPEFRMQQVY